MISREDMVRRQLRAQGIHDPRVLDAMGRVPRERLVPPSQQHHAYADSALPIGEGQTISQPYIVARMTEVLRLQPEDRVLEIGTGSGYQAAVLAEIVAEVYSVEVIRSLQESARKTLTDLGYDNIHFRLGDGSRGWPEEAPFDAVIVTCAAPEIPPALIEQLAPGGRLCLPLGPPSGIQTLVLVEKDERGVLHQRDIDMVRFVPLVQPEDRPDGD